MTKTIHVLVDGLTVDARVRRAGERIPITKRIAADAIDAFGDSWIEMTPEEQRARWGEQRFEVQGEVENG